jgi:histone deacetylase 1/2
MQTIGLVGMFQSTPKETHLKAVKRIFRYLQVTLEFGLRYPKTEDFTLNAYNDVDCAGSTNDRENTTRGAFFLGKCLVSWLNKKKTSISLSTIEAEYIVATTYCTQVIWMKQTLEDLQVKYDHPILLNCDNTSAINLSNNTSAINLSKNLVMHYKNKHIPIEYNFLRDQVSQKIFKVEYVDTKEQIVDKFTKTLQGSDFENLQ